MKVAATMTDKNAKPELAVSRDENGNEVHTDAHGEVHKIVNARGKEYVAKNIGAKADASLVKAIEDFRWANQMSVGEVVLAAVKDYIARG